MQEEFALKIMELAGCRELSLEILKLHVLLDVDSDLYCRAAKGRSGPTKLVSKACSEI